MQGGEKWWLKEAWSTTSQSFPSQQRQGRAQVSSARRIVIAHPVCGHAYRWNDFAPYKSWVSFICKQRSIIVCGPCQLIHFWHLPVHFTNHWSLRKKVRKISQEKWLCCSGDSTGGKGARYSTDGGKSPRGTVEKSGKSGLHMPGFLKSSVAYEEH